MTQTPSTPKLRAATISDLSSIAKCWYDAFFDDEVIGKLMHPNRKEYPEDVYWFLLRGIRERFWDWRHQFIVATIEKDRKEDIVGVANWRRVGSDGENMELPAWDPRNIIKPAVEMYHKASLVLFPNRAADPSKTSFLTDAVSNSEQYWVGEHAECWDLYACGVHPDFQGQGIGRALVNWGTDKADEEGVSASVICGEKNRGFYGKAGLVELQKTKNKSGGLVLFRDPKLQR